MNKFRKQLVYFIALMLTIPTLTIWGLKRAKAPSAMEMEVMDSPFNEIF